MKSRDSRVIRCLANACEETGFHLLLANMTRTQHDDEHDHYREDGATSTELDYVTNLSGNRIGASKKYKMNELLDHDLYKERAADSDDEGDFIGNASAPSEHCYHDSVSGLADLPCWVLKTTCLRSR